MRGRKKGVRAVAILATYNEERFVRGCIENLVAQGVDVYLIDNSSADRTVEIAREYLGRGLIDIEAFPRGDGVYKWRDILRRKEELARTLEADWFMHVDADEIHLPPWKDRTLAEAFARVQKAGYDAVDFQEFVFVPTREDPDHDGPDYEETMRWYYPFTPSPGFRLVRAWKKREELVGLSNRGGHMPDLPDMRPYPERFLMKHYIFLSKQHLLEKYGNRAFEKEEVDRGWHGWRRKLKEQRITLPSREDLKLQVPGKNLDASNPRTQHVTEDWTMLETPQDMFFQQKQEKPENGQGGQASEKQYAGRTPGDQAPPWQRNREGLSDYDIRWNWSTTLSASGAASGFTSVMRVKDEALSLPWVLPAMLRSVEHVILVDNNSSDGTPEIAKELARDAGLEEKLTVLSYPFEVSRCGPEHLGTYPDSVHSLTYFYNWSFSHVESRYALKWDGDMVLTGEGEQMMRELAWQLEGIGGTVQMALSPVYVESESVVHVDLARTHRELCGWPNTPNHTFIKCFDWETVRPWSDYLLQMPDWACFELKWLDQDQFSHWSHTDFQAGHYRKKREWEVTRSLLEGSPPPEGIARIESPGEKPVIEYLRENYVTLRRHGPGALAAGSTSPSVQEPQTIKNEVDFR